MSAAMAMPGNTAEKFLVHFFGTGLADDRYVVERFRARADGDIVPAPAEAPRAKSGRKTKRTTATLKAVREMRPACTEIIICTGLKARGGMQVWGSIAGRPTGPVSAGRPSVHSRIGRKEAVMAYYNIHKRRRRDLERFRRRNEARRAAGLCLVAIQSRIRRRVVRPSAISCR